MPYVHAYLITELLNVCRCYWTTYTHSWWWVAASQIELLSMLSSCLSVFVLW